MSNKINIALVGNPNSGKTSLFNVLTGLNQKVGNFPGVTVDKKTGFAAISENCAATIIDLQKLGFSAPQDMVPNELYGIDQLTNLHTLLLLVIGGLLIGFGTRWAGGCTSGHAITGLSELQLPSLIAVIGFFIGGLFMTHILYPFIF